MIASRFLATRKAVQEANNLGADFATRRSKKKEVNSKAIRSAAFPSARLSLPDAHNIRWFLPVRWCPMLEPQRALVRPRALAPATGQSLLLEDLVADLVLEGNRLPIRILGGP